MAIFITVHVLPSRTLRLIWFSNWFRGLDWILFWWQLNVDGSYAQWKEKWKSTTYILSFFVTCVFISKGDSVKVRARRLTAFISSSFVPLHFTGLESLFSFWRPESHCKEPMMPGPGIIIIRQRDKWLFLVISFLLFSLSSFWTQKSRRIMKKKTAEKYIVNGGKLSRQWQMSFRQIRKRFSDKGLPTYL